MLRIISHIEQLLFSHDCVIVPDFGGFVLRNVSAWVDNSSHMFYPPRKDVGFNATLKHSDGLLAESYMRKYSVNYNTARLMIEEDVAELKKYMQDNGKISFEAIGSFSIGEEGQMVYKSASDSRFGVNNYAFVPFEMSTLDEILSAESVNNADSKVEKKRNTVYIPINRTFLKAVSATAAAVALFFVFSTPVNDVNHSAYKASFVPTELSFETTVQAEAIVNPDSLQKTEEAETTEDVIVEHLERTEQPAAAVKVEVKNQKMYHIVVGSFPSEKQANEFLSSIDKATFANASMVLRNDKYRVYVDKFDNRESAEKYIETVRNNPKYKDAWLFISK